MKIRKLELRREIQSPQLPHGPSPTNLGWKIVGPAAILAIEAQLAVAVRKELVPNPQEREDLPF